MERHKADVLPCAFFVDTIECVLLLGCVQANVGPHLVVTDCYRASVPPPETKLEASGQTTDRFMPCRPLRTSELWNRLGPWAISLGPAIGLRPDAHRALVRTRRSNAAISCRLRTSRYPSASAG